MTRIGMLQRFVVASLFYFSGERKKGFMTESAVAKAIPAPSAIDKKTPVASRKKKEVPVPTE